MTRRFLTLTLATCAAFASDAVDPSKFSVAPTTAWPTYNGDYSGRRFSPLTKLNATNVQSLSLAWVYRMNTGQFGGGSIKATPLVIDGVMYLTFPDHVWAIDARSGREIWHHAWNSVGGMHIGNRGAAAYKDTLYFETPDCHLVALNRKTGAEKWNKTVCDLDLMYYGSVAPVVIKDKIVVGVSGDDLDIPGYLEARDLETGELKWHWSVVPKKGEPGFDTWPNSEAAAHGGGMTWIPVTYDPELNLVYVATGNPQPVIAGKGRIGDNLFTESIVALDMDTAKMKWWFQPSPHDTHDWDATQTPVLIDGTINGQPRKLIAQASRNGFFFVLDRATGKSVVTKEYVKTNWSKGIDAKGQPIPDPAKMPQFDGALVTPNQAGAANWPPPSFSPQTGLFYVNASHAYSVYYLFDTDEKPEGWGGNDRGGWGEAMLQAIDYKTGNIKWSHKWDGGGGRSGVLSTAGNLVFAGDSSNNIVALNASTGEPLWHANLGQSVSNGPISFEMDGKQYVVAAAGDSLYTFVLHSK
jgi:alcohol dehydrogenase (cytochrome c)